MANAEIRAACRLVPGGWDCHVKVRDQAGPTGATDFDVTVSEQELTRYGGECAPERLVMASFRFMLEREPLDAILRRFSLSTIESYFPEYPTEIGSYLD